MIKYLLILFVLLCVACTPIVAPPTLTPQPTPTVAVTIAPSPTLSSAHVYLEAFLAGDPLTMASVYAPGTMGAAPENQAAMLSTLVTSNVTFVSYTYIGSYIDTTRGKTLYFFVTEFQSPDEKQIITAIFTVDMMTSLIEGIE